MIHDECWWQTFGGQIQMNWEAGRILQYTTRDTDGLTTLIHEDTWSNDGVFALIQGLRRLREVGGTRVHLPTITQETISNG